MMIFPSERNVLDGFPPSTHQTILLYIQAVVTAPNVPAGELEGEKFLLKGPGAHDKTPFPALSSVDVWQPPVPPAAQHQQPLPAKPECYLGRNVETYRVVTGVLDRRLVTVTGPQGVGKSSVAIAAINYLAERHYFSDGVVYVDCSGVASLGALSELVAAQIAGHGAVEPPVGSNSASPLKAAVGAMHAMHAMLALDGVCTEVRWPRRSDFLPWPSPLLSP